MVKKAVKGTGLNFIVGGAIATKFPAPSAAPKGTGQLRKGRVKSHQLATPHTPAVNDTMDKTAALAPLLGGPPPTRNVPAGVAPPTTTVAIKVIPQIEIEPAPETTDGVLTGSAPDGFPEITPEHRTRFRQFSARNARTGSKDAELQTRLINEKAAEQYGDKWFDKPIPAPPPLQLKSDLNNRFEDPNQIETFLFEELQQTPTSPALSGHLVDPTNVFVQPHEGASAVTRIMGNFVLKGYRSKSDAEVEYAGNRFMQLSGEASPDMHLGSPELCENIMAVDSDYKKPDIVTNVRNPRMLEVDQPMHLVEWTPVEDPLHCLVMPRLFASNLANILEDASLRTSLKKNIGPHIRELSRIAFKDLLIGNSDRVIRMTSEDESPPYIRTMEALKYTGSPMNAGNIMFQTTHGEVHPHTAIAIDNYGHSRNKITTEEGQKKDLTAFEHYLNDIQSTSTQSTAEVLRGDHITSFIFRALKMEFNSDHLFPDGPVLTLSDEELHSTIRKGVLDGWSQVCENVDALQEFLKAPLTQGAGPEEHTLAYLDLVSKKLHILKAAPKPRL